MLAGLTLLAGSFTAGAASPEPSTRPGDLVYVTMEDSSTLTVIDPVTNTVKGTVNLTSFDEDPRPPFRFVTGGVMPAHAAMTAKPLYHGAIHIHGAAPSPDQRLIASTGRGSSNVYLIDAEKMTVIGNVANPRAAADTNPTLLTSGVIVGREPHEPTFSRNGKELWVALRGEDRIAILDTEQAKAESAGSDITAVRAFLPTPLGPSQVWFNRDGTLAFVISQKEPQVAVFKTNVGADGYSRPALLRMLDISRQDPFGFTPFQKLSPDGKEMWFSHKLADGVSSRSIDGEQALVDHLALDQGARPNHIEFVENANGRVVYVTQARVDDGGPDNVASSRIAIIDRSAPGGQRKVVGTFYSRGRDSHGIWTNPANDRLYVAHEQDELPGTPFEGQGVVSVFDVSHPLEPKLITRIPVGHLELPSGKLRNKKGINLIYVRPGSPTHSG
ncbi:MAG: YncE family protein [Steroidobacteraceae bacterium]